VSFKTSRCRIVYDDEWRPELAEAFRRDPSRQALQRGLEELADTLGGLVDRPDEVVLVPAVRLASAVQRRQPGVAYHTERGIGIVAARTMKRADGTIEVIIETELLLDIANEGPRTTAAGLPQMGRSQLAEMKSTIIHEAQHANMYQREAGFDQFDEVSVLGADLRWGYAVAAKILDEYRAEFNAAQAASRQPPSISDVLEVLEHLGNELVAANARYQRAPTSEGVATLMQDVYNACAPCWTYVAYWAAQFRGNGLDLPAEIDNHKLWKRYVGPTWAELMQILDDTPVEDLGTPGTTLRQAAAHMTNWVSRSLQHIGFRHVNDAEGEAFYIERFDFPGARS